MIKGGSAVTPSAFARVRSHAVCAAALALAVALAGVTRATAARPPAVESLTSSISGSLVLTWQGDPARGCAAAGLCGVVGTETGGGTSSGDETNSTSGSGAAAGLTAQLINLPGAPVVREIRTGGGAAGGCVDAAAALAGAGVAVVPIRSGVRVSDSGSAIGPFPPGSGLLGVGRCAGPLPGDLAGLLPSRTVSDARLRRGVVVSLAADRTYVAGPFSGTLHSTLRLALRLSTGDGSAGSSFLTLAAPARAPRVVEVASVTRRFSIADDEGGLQATFTGGPAPVCAVLDACGVTGTSTLAAVRGTVLVQGEGDLPASAGASPAQALRLFGNGALPTELSAGTGTSATITETAARIGAPTCRDSATIPLVLSGQSGGLVVESLPAPGGMPAAAPGTMLVRLPSLGFGGGVADLLRTRCEGPSDLDLFPAQLGGGGAPPALASAPVPAAQLLTGGSVGLTFTSTAVAGGGAYAVSEAGPLIVTLVPEGAARVVVRREVAR